MKRTCLVALALSSALVGCGDNSNQCDPATTMSVDGVCVAIGDLTCSDGTILVDDHCEVDPASCQDGTVLVGGACVDPGHLTADLEEAAEPNGLGIFEQSADPAGEIVLKPAGQSFVIHGKIIPFQDDDGDGQTDVDIDTYFVDVAGPVMLTISADGLHGLAGGFVSIANVASTDPMADWTRFGVNLLGDTSQRQVYLPVAGTYLLAIGDTRTLLLTGAAAGAASGRPDFEYYVSIEQTPVTPVALTVTDGVATSTGTRTPGEVKLFTVAMGEGINSATLETENDQVEPSLLITNTAGTTTSLKGIADGTPADVTAIGVRTGDTSIVVVDSFIDYANQPTAYDLTVNVGTAGALSTTGMDVSQPGSETDFSVFYYDVVGDVLTLGMDLAFDVPVSGVVVDEDFFIFANFSFDPAFGFAFGDTFQSYKGLLRHAQPGRYYFLVFDPAFDPAAPTDITATSTYEGLTPVPVVKGTPLTAQAVNAYESNPFTYAPDTAADPWQQFTGTGTGTGTITGRFFAPNAFGKLDADDGTCGSFCDDATPVFTHTYLAAGQTRGRILLDDNAATYFVTVNTATVTGATFDLSFATRSDASDLGALALGTPIAANDEALDTTTTIQRYLVKTVPGYGVTIDVSPDDVTMDTRIQRLNADETSLGALGNNGGVGAPDSLFSIQNAGGWTAFTVVSSTAPVAAGTFDLTVTASPPPYTTSAGATPFADACVNGTAITLDDDDEGQSGSIAAPAGFDFFGAPAPNFVVFANGFLSFDTALTCASVGGSCFFSNADMPNAANPNALVAPYWDDLIVTSVCQETIGTKLVIQWQGARFGDSATTVSTQAILDGATDTIEFVYEATQTGTGSSATIGIENQIGVQAEKRGFNQAGTAVGTLFTPN